MNSGSDTIYDFDLTEDSLVFYARQSFNPANADVGFEGVSLNNGVLSWEDVTIDLNNAALNDLDKLDIEFLYV